MLKGLFKKSVFNSRHISFITYNYDGYVFRFVKLICYNWPYDNVRPIYFLKA